MKYYFARVAAMRAEVFMKNGGRGSKPDPQKMWGTLVDMQTVDANAQKLLQEGSFLKAYQTGQRQEMLQGAVDLLYPDESKKWEPGGLDIVTGERLKDKELDANSESGRSVGQ